jgi:hypothetical protein
MKTKRGQRKGVWGCVLRGPFSIILVLALLAPGLAAGERRGAQVVVIKKDGKIVQGELLAVKGTDLLIMDLLTSAAVTENLTNISSVDKVEKKSNWLPGMIIGVLAGGAVGALVEQSKNYQNLNAADKYPKGQVTIAGAVGFGLLGAYIGGRIKAKAIKVERTDPEYLAGVAAKLKNLARERS